MRLIFESLILAVICTTALSANEGDSSTNTEKSLAATLDATEAGSSTPETGTTSSSTLSNLKLVISWQHTDDWTPFSTDDLYYEVWHDENYFTVLDDNTITLSIQNYPELGSGCIQIRAVLGDEQSSLSDKTCYEIIAGTNKLVLRKSPKSEESIETIEPQRASRRKKRKA